MKPLLAMAIICAGSVLAADIQLAQPYYVWPRTGAQHIDLSAGWELGQRDSQVDKLASLPAEWIHVAEPTSVHMALHKAGKLPHPYVNLNSDKYEWVDQKVWYYRKTFASPQIADAYAFLYFHGIDYFARIWLNGELLGAHEGMFGGPAVEVSKLLRPSNDLVVEVRAGNWGNKAGYKPRDPGRVIKPWVISGGTGGEMFFSVGMWQGARLEIVPRIHLERPFLSTKVASAQAATLHLSVEVLNGTQSLEYQLHATGNTQMRYSAPWWKLQPRNLTLDFALLDKNGAVEFQKILAVNVQPGRNWVEQDIAVPKPKLWWPNGMGDPHLYTARLTLKDGASSLDALSFDFGIRTLRMEMTPGPRLQDRWAPWQFVINGRKVFMKGVNWMPADILLDLPRQRYHWLLSAVRNAGIQLVRVWGGGILEPEAFYSVANELGILVWQDFPIGNMVTPLFPQPVWEAQVMHTIFRLRNHPSLALWCGGNEFNPYAEGNAASVGILERSLASFDPTRPFRRTSPDEGSMHDYPDMDPSWYARTFPFLPYMSETGMHNIPNAASMREVVSNDELARPLERMYAPDFAGRFPDLRHHFVEYDPNRVPRMLSRASHVIDISKPSIDDLAEATQIGAGEFYQVMSEALQSNYPITAGMMPWVFKRPWPVIAIQLMDGFGHPTAPYYFLKRAYEPVHIAWKAEHLLWAPGENLAFNLAVMNSRTSAGAALTASVRVLDDGFRALCTRSKPVEFAVGPSVAMVSAGSWQIPSDYRDRFLFVVAELKDAAGRILSRQVYWPRSLQMLSDGATRASYRSAPKEWPALDKGPWLRPAIAANTTLLKVSVLRTQPSTAGRSKVEVRVSNTGRQPAFPVRVVVDGAKLSAVASDNFFWLDAGETRDVSLEVLWREPAQMKPIVVSASAWNTDTSSAPMNRDPRL